MILLNIILITLIIRLIVELVFKLNPYAALSCGIFGYYGKTSRKFQWLKFDILGLDNDKRGGDACGRIVRDIVEHSNSHGKKKYADYINTYLPPKLRVKDQLMIGHTRKSSWGANKDGIEYTQPIPFYNKETTEIDFVFAHNGTLYNHKELAKEYKIDKPDTFWYPDEVGDLEPINEMNDSQILGWILGYKKDYEVLKKYKGGAAFALYDYRENKLYLWSGSSLKTAYAKVDIEERPLHMLKSKDHLWFGSLEDSLKFINYSEEDEVEELENNVLYVFQDGVEIEQIKVDRSESYQYNKVDYKKPKEKAKTSTVHKKNENSSLSYRECDICNATGYFQGSYECPSCHGQGYIQVYVPVVKPKKDLSSLTNPYHKEEKPVRIWGEEAQEKNNLTFKYLRGRYYHKGKEAHGIFHINEMGILSDNKKDYTNSKGTWQHTKIYYFIKGIMVEDHNSFRKLACNIKKEKTLGYANLLKIQEVAMHPVYNDMNSLVQSKEITKGSYNYTGSYMPLFSYYMYKVSNGVMISKEKDKDGPSTPDHHSGNKQLSDLPFDIEGATVISESEKALLNKGDECANCDGFGITKDGNKCTDCDEYYTIPSCIFCNDTGFTRDDKVCNCKAGDDVPESFRDDDYAEDNSFENENDDPLYDQIKRELSEELSAVMNQVEDAKSATYIYSDNVIAQRVEMVLSDIKTVLEGIKL